MAKCWILLQSIMQPLTRLCIHVNQRTQTLLACNQCRLHLALQMQPPPQGTDELLVFVTFQRLHRRLLKIINICEPMPYLHCILRCTCCLRSRPIMSKNKRQSTRRAVQQSHSCFTMSVEPTYQMLIRHPHSAWC